MCIWCKSFIWRRYLCTASMRLSKLPYWLSCFVQACRCDSMLSEPGLTMHITDGCCLRLLTSVMSTCLDYTHSIEVSTTFQPGPKHTHVQFLPGMNTSELDSAISDTAMLSHHQALHKQLQLWESKLFPRSGLAQCPLHAARPCPHLVLHFAEQAPANRHKQP